MLPMGWGGQRVEEDDEADDLDDETALEMIRATAAMAG
jgi:hypothetical protein